MTMGTERTYYEILEVPRNADGPTIKSSFRRLARANHPDRNGGDRVAEERLKAINEAYAVLSDPTKRVLYDEFGKAGLGTRFDPVAERVRRVVAAAKELTERFRPAIDIAGEVPVDTSVMRSGGEISIWLRRSIPCGSCSGSGLTGENCQRCSGTGKIGTTHRNNCSTCQGSNLVMVRRPCPCRTAERRPLFCHTCFDKGSYSALEDCGSCGGQVLGETCNSCRGTGKPPCESCSGKGSLLEQKDLPVEIQPGAWDGMIVHLLGLGSQLIDGTVGDVYMTVRAAKAA